MQINPVSTDQNSAVRQVPGQFANFDPGRKPVRHPESERREAAHASHLAALEKTLTEHNISLKFSTDDTTKALVVSMVDEKTGEAIRQFPTAVSLALAANFIKLQGQFVDKTE